MTTRETTTRTPAEDAPSKITRALILRNLRGPDAKQNTRPRSEGSWEAVQDLIIPRVEVSIGSLKDARVWLFALADQEQKRVEFISEFKNDDGWVSEIALSSPLDTEILTRIAAGQVPAPKEQEDLLAPFREGNAERGGSSYEELTEVIHKWNQRVLREEFGNGNRPDQREELLYLLEERVRVVTCVKRGKCPKSDLEDNNGRLLAALHAFRPDTTRFATQRPYAILVTMVANTRIADPDIRLDPELWLNVWKALFVEVRFWLTETSKEQKSLEQQLALAAACRDHKNIDRLRTERSLRDHEIKKQSARALLSDVKQARKNLYRRALDDLEELTIAQAAQKGLFDDRDAPEPADLYETCDAVDAELVRLFQDDGDVLRTACEATDANIDILRGMSADSYRRARKFAAMDIKDLAERAKVRKERMTHPGTATMMVNVKQETERMWATSKLVLRRVESMESKMQDIYAAAKRRLGAYDAVYNEVEKAIEQYDKGKSPQAG
ncbi:hypothetical protein M011DRAFT_465530 [Sporormia fimetaria CBS 119925]|uniref:Uncharacterized protein n=1 Tax=Sporormia fimetaria CBS 119925 TaxID=1340428 RepID=A0A6A6VJ87_9PLEO|nr:hypothetical protein M011DRAFT_465530 [Sporormia fimetaria CBS 119925]